NRMAPRRIGISPDMQRRVRTGGPRTDKSKNYQADSRSQIEKSRQQLWVQITDKNLRDRSAEAEQRGPRAMRRVSLFDRSFPFSREHRPHKSILFYRWPTKMGIRESSDVVVTLVECG